MNIDHDFDTQEDLTGPIADKLRRDFRIEFKTAISDDFVSRVLAQAKQTESEDLACVRDAKLVMPGRSRMRRQFFALAAATAIACGFVIWVNVGFDRPPASNARSAASSKIEVEEIKPNEAPMGQEDFRQGAELISSGIGGTLASLNFARDAAVRILHHDKLSNIGLVRHSPSDLQLDVDPNDSLQSNDNQVVAKFTAKVLGLHSF